MARQALLIGEHLGLRIIGSSYSADARRLLEFAARNRLAHSWVDVEHDSAAEGILRTVVLEGGTWSSQRATCGVSLLEPILRPRVSRLGRGVS